MATFSSAEQLIVFTGNRFTGFGACLELGASVTWFRTKNGFVQKYSTHGSVYHHAGRRHCAHEFFTDNMTETNVIVKNNVKKFKLLFTKKITYFVK